MPNLFDHHAVSVMLLEVDSSTFTPLEAAFQPHSPPSEVFAIPMPSFRKRSLLAVLKWNRPAKSGCVARIWMIWQLSKIPCHGDGYSERNNAFGKHLQVSCLTPWNNPKSFARNATSFAKTPEETSAANMKAVDTCSLCTEISDNVHMRIL